MADPTARWRRPAWVAAISLLLLLVGVPLYQLASAGAGELGAGSGEALNRAGWEPVVNTLWTGIVVALLALFGSTLAALATERAVIPGRRWLRVGFLIPLLVPPFVSALSWARAYGPGGLTDDLFGLALPGLFGPIGVILVIAVHVMPLGYVVIAAGLASRAEPDLERAARASGASGWRALRTVSLPLLGPALLGGFALMFVATINSFGIPAILGTPAGFATVTTRVYQDLALAADPASFSRAVLLATGLVVVALLVVGAADLVAGGVGTAPRTAAPSGPGVGVAGRARWPVAAAAWAYLIVTTGLPLLGLISAALTRAVGLPPTPSNWTLGNFAEALAGRYPAALGRSVLLAVAAATAVVVMGGLLAAFRRRRLGRSLGTVALLTFAVPGSTLAVAVLLAYGPWLRDTLIIILIAYLAKFWALGHRAVAGSADALPPDLSRAARVSGSGPFTALRTVVVPLLRPALVGAWLLVFLFGFHELTMSSLLYGPGTDTIAVVVLNLQQLGDVTVTSAMGVLLTLPVVVAVAAVLVLRDPASRVMRLE